MTPDRSASSHRCQRTGFTLLELLLAIGLSLALLAAVSTSLLNYYRWRDAGERQVENARTRLAWTTALANDISSISGADVDQRRLLEANALATASKFETNSMLGREQFLDLGLDFALESLDLYGEEDFLAIGRLVPSTAQSRLGKYVPPLRHQVTVWTTRPSSAWKVPHLDSAGNVAYRTVDVQQRPRFALPMPSDRASSANPIQRAIIDLGKPIQWSSHNIYTESITTLSFRYYSGTEWVDRWNSQALQSLPLAIEMTIVTQDTATPATYCFRLIERRDVTAIPAMPVGLDLPPSVIPTPGARS